MSTDIDELTRERLRTEVALEISSAIAESLEDLWQRDLVLTDIVDCWLALPPDVRETYENGHRDPGVVAFANHYVDEVDELSNHLPVTARCVCAHKCERCEARIPEVINDKIVCGNWVGRIMLIQRRLVTGAPPEPAWLKRFEPRGPS